MRHVRRILLLILFLAIAGGVWGAVYIQRKGFFGTWRTLVEDEFAKRGYYTRIGRVTLGPLQGLVAEDVFFFQDPERKRKIASVDNVILDLDLTEILNRDLSINTLDFKDADLSLPLEPGRRDSEMLRVEQFSGRVVVTESRIEFVKAQANLQGIEVTLKGSLHRPPLDAETAGDPVDTGEQRRRLRELGQRIGAFQAILQEIDRIEFDPFRPPRLEVEFSGDLADLAGLRASARLSAENFERENYPIEELSASMEFDGEQGRATLRELHLRDARGDLRLRADWPIDGDEVSFDLHSTADLPALVASIYPNPKMGEVRFFDPPRLKVEGTFRLDRWEEAEFPDLPIEAIGHFGSDRFASRGTVFDDLEFNFSVSGNRYYVRNLGLAHKTGTLLANLIYDPALETETFRYQSEIKLDPKVFIPFVESEEARRFLSMWDFNRNSDIYVAAMGSGPGLDPETWHTRGLMDLKRGLRLNGVRFSRMEGEFEFDSGGSRIYRNVRLGGAEGLLTAAEAVFRAREDRWDVTNLRWTLDLTDGIRMFSADLTREMEPYAALKGAELTVNGTIDSRSDQRLAGRPRRHHFRAEFESPAAMEHEFAGTTLALLQPRGVFSIEGKQRRLSEFRAGLFGGTLEADLRVDSDGGRRGRLSLRDADLFAIPPFLPLQDRVGDAGTASATLEWEGGVLKTEDLESRSAAASFRAAGTVEPASHSIRFEATHESGTPPETHHYSGTGHFEDPTWKTIEKPVAEPQ